MARLATRARQVRLGDPQDAATQMGPIVSETQMERVLDSIRIGRGEGARLVAGGAREGDRGCFVHPTVFADVTADMRIAQEEIFCSGAAATRFRDDEALRIANCPVFSLTAGIWGADMTRVRRFTRKQKAGMAWVNTFGPTDIHLPWGGARDPQFGRAHDEAALANFTGEKSVWINGA